MKFLIFSNFTSNNSFFWIETYYISILNNLYIKKDFKKIYDLLIDIKKNIFLTDKQKKFVYFSYNNNIRLKYIVNKIEKKIKLDV